jgi:hypothetical protein
MEKKYYNIGIKTNNKLKETEVIMTQKQYLEIVEKAVKADREKIVSYVLTTPNGFESWVLVSCVGELTLTTQTPSTRPTQNCGLIATFGPVEGDTKDYEGSAEYWDFVEQEIYLQARASAVPV